MDTNILYVGFQNAISPLSLLFIFGGIVIGMFVGAVPGLSATMALALILPITYSLSPEIGLSAMAAIYVGALYGGSIAAILLNTPGTPSAAATALDGYPLAKSGKAKQALGLSLSASFIGGLIASVALLTATPLLGVIVLEFGPVELFAVAVLGITIIGSLSQGSALLGLLSGTLGLMLSTVGMDLLTGTARMSFGNMNLISGINFTIVLIGLFSIPQAITLLEESRSKNQKTPQKLTGRMMPGWKQLRSNISNVLRSSGIGVIVGMIPGTGGDTASWYAYNEARRFSKEPEKFGKGASEGIVSAESANNAVVGGALIPTMALGIPGSSTTAVLLGALMVHGILPGPDLLDVYGDITYTLIWSVFFANFALLIAGLLFTRLAINVTRIPDALIACAILIFCIVGSYAVNNNFFDIWVMLIFGLFGYLLKLAGMPPAPMVIGLILGPVMETSFQQSMLMGNDSFTIFLQSPIASILLALALFSILQMTSLPRTVFRSFSKVWKNTKKNQ